MQRLCAAFCFALCAGALAAQTTGIQVEASCTGVKVYVQGSLRGETTLDTVTGLTYFRVALLPGEYRVRCECPGYDPVESTLTVSDAFGFAIYRITLTSTAVRSEGMGPTQSSAKRQVGTIRVFSVPSGASVELDGTTMAHGTDCRLLEVPVGDHTVRVYFGTKASLAAAVSLASGQVVDIHVDFRTSSVRSEVMPKPAPPGPVRVKN